MIYTISSGNRAIGYVDTITKTPYVIGFRSASYARKVQYDIHPTPKITLIRNEQIEIRDETKQIQFLMDIQATLFIPKSLDTVFNPNDTDGFYVQPYEDETFMTMPFTKKVGVILPYKILEESDSEIIFKVNLIEPNL